MQFKISKRFKKKLQSSIPSPPFPHSLLKSLIPVTIKLNSTNCLSLSLLLIDINVPSSLGGNTLCNAAKIMFIINFNIQIFLFHLNYSPVASLTTEMSVGLPNPDLNKIAETIFLYKPSKSSLVLARESVISRMTGWRRESRTRLCSSKNSATQNS